MEVIRSKLETIEKDCEEIKDKIDELDNRLENISERTLTLEVWRNGNGARGSEARLQDVEDGLMAYSRERIIPRLNCVEADMQAVQRIADHAIQTGVNDAVNATLDKREKTTIAKIKAWGPYAATAVVLVGMVLDKLVK